MPYSELIETDVFYELDIEEKCNLFLNLCILFIIDMDKIPHNKLILKYNNIINFNELLIDKINEINNRSGKYDIISSYIDYNFDIFNYIIIYYKSKKFNL